MWSMPSRSASSTWASASLNSRCSVSPSHGRGSWCSYKSPKRIVYLPVPSSRPKPSEARRSGGTSFPVVTTKEVPRLRFAPLGTTGLVRRPAAVDHQAGAGHEARVVGRQEHDALGDVLRHAQPADRMQGQRGLARLLGVVGVDLLGAHHEGLLAH